MLYLLVDTYIDLTDVVAIGPIALASSDKTDVYFNLYRRGVELPLKIRDNSKESILRIRNNLISAIGVQECENKT